MSVDASVIAALETAIAVEPGNPALRVHLASLLVMAGDPGRALEHAQAALSAEPDHAEALATARDASRALGDHDKAERYARLLGGFADTAAAFDADRWVETDAGIGPVDEDETQGPLVIPEGFTELDPEGLPAPDRPRVTLDDVGGLEQVKARLDAAFLAPLRNPELRAYYGKSLRGGLLLYGPPGCGKTFLARAVAGELGASFFALGLNDVLDMWLGESERRLHDAFASARRAAPCVLFLDELDALGQKRSQMRHSAGRNVVNQLLAELDGAQADNEGVFVLAATNHPWDVDTALRRPGRLDRTVLVLPPDLPARETIFRKALAGRPIRGVDTVKLARRTDGCSGADIVHIVESASELALQESVRTGAMHPITQGQLDQAASETAPSTRAWFGIAHNYAVYANEGGQFDDLLAYIRTHKLL
ncbi:AAA family ATPase [Solirubrobacter phytolaccae]|uniref:AAA family ATPase n=1 Tax=Solirubrobacter phytolaccae TaxID=1404360 RepID=A0A9X3N6X4_9ACTN|nr:ATP-binding protein [Solirubrobacter phytolaccae]MDA0179595.1 AAA family ATPase [Solirubrobacter phytolaccae]